MPLRTRYASLVLVTMLLVSALPLATWAQAAMPVMAVESQPTAAGALAIENHWILAEMTGDTAFLEQFLLPPYRSVNNDGSANPKAAIVAHAAKRSGTDAASAQRALADYRKAHPYGTSVVLHGALAIITFYDPALGAEKGVKSSDVLVYGDGHWHAIYSQHTSVGH